jgi:hypothetical protein
LRDLHHIPTGQAPNIFHLSLDLKPGSRKIQGQPQR